MRLTERVIEILQTVTIDGAIAKIPQLPRPDYVAVNKALELLGGKWNRKQGGHLFDCDPNEPIAAAVATGEVTDWKKEFQFFETPAELAIRMVELADIQPTHKVLEPSAGRGGILRHIPTGNGRSVVAVELNPDMAQALTNTGLGWDVMKVAVTQGNFLELGTTFGLFDRVVMNPPFSKGQDIEHVRHAFHLLKPQGRLVAITGPGWTFRNDAKHTAFRKWANDLGAEVTDLPAGTFKTSGTMVSAKLIVMEN